MENYRGNLRGIKPKTLVSVVINILKKKVSEDEAKNFALNNYGILAAYIRNEFLETITKPKTKGKIIGKKVFGSTLEN